MLTFAFFGNEENKVVTVPTRSSTHTIIPILSRARADRAGSRSRLLLRITYADALLPFPPAPLATARAASFQSDSDPDPGVGVVPAQSFRPMYGDFPSSSRHGRHSSPSTPWRYPRALPRAGGTRHPIAAEDVPVPVPVQVLHLAQELRRYCRRHPRMEERTDETCKIQ